MARGPDLSREAFNCADVMACLFNLSKIDLEVLAFLGREGPSRTDAMGRALGRDPSTIFRSVRRLSACGLASRRRHLIEGGGYYYTYESPSPQAIKAKVRACLDAWYKRMAAAIDGGDAGEPLEGQGSAGEAEPEP